MMWRTLLVTIVALALTGCASGPDGPKRSRHYPVTEGDCVRVYLSESGTVVEGRLLSVYEPGGPRQMWRISPPGGGSIGIKPFEEFIDAAGTIPCPSGW